MLVESLTFVKLIKNDADGDDGDDDNDIIIITPKLVLAWYGKGAFKV